MKNAQFLLIFLFFQISLSAQTYVTAVGVRVDKGFGLTGQQYIGNNWTLEGILHIPFRSNEFGATIMGEKHKKIILRNLNFYTGGGAHYYWKTGDGMSDTSIKNNVFGLTGIGGVELSMGRLNISVDFKPELHISGDQPHPFEWRGTSISVRYILEKRSRNRVKDWDVWDKMPKRKKRK